MPRNLVLFLLTFAAPLVYARPEFVPIQERAQGQSLVGADLLNDSLYANPAASAFSQVYAVEGLFALPRTFAISILDTKSSAIGGGVGYLRVNPRDGGDPLQSARLSLLGRISQAVGVGVTGKMLWGRTADGRDATMKDADTGVLVKLDPMTLGLTIHNVLGGNAEIGQNQEWSFGGRIGIRRQLFLSAATVSDWSRFAPYQYGFGLEYQTPYYVSVKGGYRFQPDRDKAYWSAGLSLMAPKVLIHYSAEFPTHGDETAEHILGATFLL